MVAVETATAAEFVSTVSISSRVSLLAVVIN